MLTTKKCRLLTKNASKKCEGKKSTHTEFIYLWCIQSFLFYFNFIPSTTLGVARLPCHLVSARSPRFTFKKVIAKLRNEKERNEIFTMYVRNPHTKRIQNRLHSARALDGRDMKNSFRKTGRWKRPKAAALRNGSRRTRQPFQSISSGRS